MIDFVALSQAFPELQNIAMLSMSTSQRVVLSAGLAGAPVVLKLLHAGLDPARTHREIEAVARVQSDRVPRILDVGKRAVAGIDVFFTIEQRISGETLSSFLQRSPKPDLSFVVASADALLEACAAFEAQRVVHRDLKPGNVMLDDNARLWVIDFGIARVLDLPSLTGTANLFGVFSPGYGAPEQIRNVKTDIDTRADLFSIGVLLYEMLLGVNPYLAGARDAMEVVRRMLSADLPTPQHPGDPTGEFALFVSNLVSRFPSRRPQNTLEAREWFEQIRRTLNV